MPILFYFLTQIVVKNYAKWSKIMKNHANHATYSKIMKIHKIMLSETLSIYSFMQGQCFLFLAFLKYNDIYIEYIKCYNKEQ